jgi:AraC-like DNA-binding protein
VTLAAGTEVFGVRFRVGAAGAALGLPQAELLDTDAAIADVLPEDAARLEEAAFAGGLAGLVGALRARVRVAAVDPITRAAAVGLAAPGARVTALGDELGISERQLRRRFNDAVGYGPKTLARVLRFQRFVALAGGEAAPEGGDGSGRSLLAGGEAAPEGGDSLLAPGAGRWARGGAGRRDLAALALDAGYADQAHLTRECVRLSGQTPAALLASGPVAAGERDVRFVQATSRRGA